MGDGVGRVVELLARGRCVVELVFAGGVGGVVGSRLVFLVEAG